MKTYKTVNGMSFDESTPNEVCLILSNANLYGWRIRVFYGDKKTGVCWNDEYDTIGKVGKSTGSTKIPLLIHNSRSTGGGAILDGSIIKIMDVVTKEVLYLYSGAKFTKFSAQWDVINEEVLVTMGDDKIIYGRCKGMRQARNLAAFMNGERMRK